MKELARAAKRSKSLKLARIAVLLESGNPFDTVIAELDAMIVLIDKEEKADDEQKAWCDSEREDSHSQLSDKKTNKGSLEGKVVELTDAIENEETGLKKFYDWLEKKQGPHHYEKKAGKDAGGGKI